jgi:periplasmic divalent cation tolerance protein
MNAISLYIPCPDRKTAGKVAKHLLRKRLIACANIFPIDSMYWWKGKIEDKKEFVIFAKSLKEKYGEILKEARSVHPYEVPLIARFDTRVNGSYLKWLKGVI